MIMGCWYGGLMIAGVVVIGVGCWLRDSEANFCG